MTYERGSRCTYRGQVCVIEGERYGRWFNGEPRRELRLTAVEDYPGEVRIEGWWVPEILVTPAPARPQGDPDATALAVDLLRGRS